MKTIQTTDFAFDTNTNTFLTSAYLLGMKELISLDEEGFFTIEVLNPVIPVVDSLTRVIYRFKFDNVSKSSAGMVYEYKALSRSKGELRLRLFN